MENSEVPKSMVEHFDLVWLILLSAVAALIYAMRVLIRYYTTKDDEDKIKIMARVEVLEANQKKVLRVIPVHALNEGLPLMTNSDCAQLRDHCQNVIISQELAASMDVIKRAIHVLVLYTDAIPKDAKEDIVKELV